ncbi:MAG: efflux RND transporter periplasmic adaptor subunit [Flavobacteriaceae bacterium]|nr:efflux RND transporter periplasmic adaptor subunit [Flavobacteriaceae bacterium]
MKKYIIYIGILIAGLLIGRFALGGNSTDSHATHSETGATAADTTWTCSMHPQIMAPEAGDCPICGMDLIPAEVGAEGLDVNEFKLSKNALALANIQTSIIGIQTENVGGLTLSGKIVENEKNNALQTTHFGGRIEKLYIETTGEKVRSGQKLALIYSPELVTTQKEFLTAIKSKDKDMTLYNAVKNKLKLWKLSETQINSIESSNQIITNFPVYASVSGIVSKKMVDEGAYVKKGQGLFNISNLSTVWADFDAYEKQLSSIKVGDKISITTNANPNKVLEARITFIDPILNSKTRTVVVRTVLNNRKGALKPGMFVAGTLSNNNAKNQKNTPLLVPKTAVMWTGKRSLVYIKKSADEPIFEMREVVLGNSFGDLYEIIEGLAIHDEIVTNGTFTVDAAAQLQSKRSMMSAAAIDAAKLKEAALNKAPEDVERLEVSEKFQGQLAIVYTNYIAIKDALVSDDPTQAAVKAKTFTTSLNDVDMKLLSSNESHMLWMPLLDKLKMAATRISNASDITEQRSQFISLSNNMIRAVQGFGVQKTVYKQHCPMANSDNGAFWLSNQEQVENPYFGDMMLKCGSVEQTIN